MALRSEQARVLRRTLLGRLGRNLAAFTAAFALICLLLEGFVMGPLADFVADSTSTWRVLDSTDRFEAIMADHGLAGGTAYLDDLTDQMGKEGLPTDPGTAEDALTWADKVGMTGIFSDAAGGAGTNESAVDSSGSVSASVVSRDVVGTPSPHSLQEALDALVATGVVKRASDASAAQAAAMGALLAGVPEQLSLVVPQAIGGVNVNEILLNASVMGYSQEDLDQLVTEVLKQSQTDVHDEWRQLPASDQAVQLGVASSNPVWQESLNPDGYWLIRDVSTYALIKSFKLPLAAAVLAAGWLVIVVMALNRSLRYFDDLSEAVARLLADRDAPIELPPGLSIAQNELAVIRSQSLADERAAQAAERRKNELVAYLAHDIRTPLTSVLGYLDLLRDAAVLPPDTQRKYAETAYAKAERLEGLIGEFFEITRYNLQAIPIERENVDVRLFCQQVAESFFPETSARGIGLRVAAPPDVRFFVDPDKLARALGNVMRNAVAYAEDGTSVDLAASCDGPWVSIAVRNRGREISEAHLEAIFEKFYREDGARTSGSGGAGLGLAIAKEIVGAHGGDITAMSRDGVTVFTLRVPREVSFARSLASRAEEAGEGAAARPRRGPRGVSRGGDASGKAPLTVKPVGSPARRPSRKR